MTVEQRSMLHFQATSCPWPEPRAFAAWLRVLFRHAWVVYSKRPFGGPEHVLRCLGAYRQQERQEAFEKLIEGKLESEVWLSLFLMKRGLWIKHRPAMSSEILTDHKRISFTIRPVGGFELDGAAGVVHLADDEQFSDRLLVGNRPARTASI